MKDYTTSDLRDRLVIYDIQETIDDEANHIETPVPVRTVWAHTEVRTATDKETPTGERPTIRRDFIIRYDPKLLPKIKKVGFKGKTSELTAPPYVIENKYIKIEATENYGE